MFIDLATKLEINTYRKERQFLLDVRNGKYTYEEIFAIYEKLDKEIAYIEKNNILPDKPDMKKIEELMIAINLNVLKG